MIEIYTRRRMLKIANYFASNRQRYCSLIVSSEGLKSASMIAQSKPGLPVSLYSYFCGTEGPF